MEDKNQIIGSDVVRKICGKKKRNTADNKIIDTSLELVIKKYLDVYNTPEPRWRPYRLPNHRRN